VFRIGLVSDTHGLLRPEVESFLRGSDAIVHGGDICDPRILDVLAGIAPLTAVRGNNDHGPWALRLPKTALVELGGIRLYAVHDVADLDIDPAAAGVRVVVTGHSHKPVIGERDGVLHVNPGSAGPRRFRLPISAGEIVVDAGQVSARIVEFAGTHAA
jgi:uncharacterized protein